jgi:hypothetical protein
MSLPEPMMVACLVAAAIERAGGMYFVGGSLASSLQGEPRATNDIDIVLDLPLGRIGALVRELGGEFEVDQDVLRDALLHGRSCNIFHLPTVTKVDLFAVGGTPFDEVEFSRRAPRVVGEGGETLVIKSPEDTVLRKLFWFEQGGRVSERGPGPRGQPRLPRPGIPGELGQAFVGDGVAGGGARGDRTLVMRRVRRATPARSGGRRDAPL